jgi:hypothetical protein
VCSRVHLLIKEKLYTRDKITLGRITSIKKVEDAKMLDPNHNTLH